MNNLKLLFDKIEDLRLITISYIITVEYHHKLDEETVEMRNISKNDSPLEDIIKNCDYNKLKESDDFNNLISFTWKQKNNLVVDVKEIIYFLFNEYPELMRWVPIW